MFTIASCVKELHLSVFILSMILLADKIAMSVAHMTYLLRSGPNLCKSSYNLLCIKTISQIGGHAFGS